MIPKPTRQRRLGRMHIKLQPVANLDAAVALAVPLPLDLHTETQDEIAVVPVEGLTQAISPIKALAKDSLMRNIRDWIGVECQVQFTSNTNANIYVPENMVATLVGKGGANIRQLQDDLGGISLSVKTFDEMPNNLERPNPYWEDMQERRSRGGKAWEHNGKSRRRKERKGRR